MVLSDKDIKLSLKSGKIKITPVPNLSECLGSCSIDLHLGGIFHVFEHSKNAFIDAAKKEKIQITKEIKLRTGEKFVMHPGDFVLAIAAENVKIAPDLMGRLEGKSSLGRMGIVVHSTASVFDPGWDGKPVLELGNLGRMAVALTVGQRICAMTFEQLSSKADVPYTKKKTARYRYQKKPI